MTSLLWLSLAALAAAQANQANQASQTRKIIVKSYAARLEEVTFFSPALGRQKTFCVVLPEGFPKARKAWPVLLLLHGRGRNRHSLVDDPEARTALLASRAVVILPDGDDGWYIDSPVKPADRYQTYIGEVLRAAETHYPLSRERARRGITGWSMGGYGCTLYAIRHAREFGALAPMIGLLDFPREGLPKGQRYTVPVDRFGTDRAVWRSLNPLTHAAALRGMAIFIQSGTTAFDRSMNLHFCDALAAAEIPYTFELLDGGHSFTLVRRAVRKVIAFMNRTIAAQ